MLDIIYVRKYLAGNQKELQKAINMFSHMDPYMKGRIPAFIEKTTLLNTKIKL